MAFSKKWIQKVLDDEMQEQHFTTKEGFYDKLVKYCGGKI